MFKGIPGLYPLDASSIFALVVTTKNVPRHCQVSPWRQKSSLVEKRCSRIFFLDDVLPSAESSLSSRAMPFHITLGERLSSDMDR